MTSNFFILGVDRSGTTLFSLMLDSHSMIAIPYESHFFVDYYKRKGELGDLGILENRKRLAEAILYEPYIKKWDNNITIKDLDLDRFISLEGAISELYETYAEKSGKKIWADKTPLYINEIDMLNNMFPESKFIHIVRDGRDVSLSIIKQWWSPYGLVSALKYWREKVLVARKMLAMLPEGRSIELRYEDLVKDPEHELRRITEFLGLEYESQMVESYVNGASSKVGEGMNSYHKNLASSPSTKHAYKWVNSLSKADQALAYEYVGDTLQELGYDSGVKHHPLKIFRKLYHKFHEIFKWRLRRLKKGMGYENK